MLTDIGLSGELGTAIIQYGRSRSSTGYILDSVEGLGPAPGNISISDYAIVPGGQFHSSTVNARNIVISIELSSDNNENKSVRELRRDLMSFFPVGGMLSVTLYDTESLDERLSTTGYLETFDVDMFSKRPLVTLSIVCPSPYLLGNNTITHGPFGRGGQTINYEGDAPTGFTLVVDFKSSGRTHLYVRETATSGDYREVYVRAVNDNFKTTRDLVINTRVGSKRAHLRGSSSGDYIENVIGDLTSVTGWPILNPGPNSIRVLDVPSGASSDIQWTLSYRNLYGGF